GLLVDQFANLLPVSTLLALLANRGHVLAPLLNCAQRAAIFRRNGRGKLFGEILRTHGLKDTVGFGSVICAVLVPPVVSSGGSRRFMRSAPCLVSCAVEPTAARAVLLVLQRKRADCGIASPVIAAVCGQNANRQSEHERGGGDNYASGRHGSPLGF